MGRGENSEELMRTEGSLSVSHNLNNKSINGEIEEFLEAQKSIGKSNNPAEALNSLLLAASANESPVKNFNFLYRKEIDGMYDVVNHCEENECHDDICRCAQIIPDYPQAKFVNDKIRREFSRDFPAEILKSLEESAEKQNERVKKIKIESKVSDYIRQHENRKMTDEEALIAIALKERKDKNKPRWEYYLGNEVRRDLGRILNKKELNNILNKTDFQKKTLKKDLRKISIENEDFDLDIQPGYYGEELEGIYLNKSKSDQINEILENYID